TLLFPAQQYKKQEGPLSSPLKAAFFIGLSGYEQSEKKTTATEKRRWGNSVTVAKERYCFLCG
ncbi:MAG: hypothetical protein D3904_15285, partial [Candidatus Electrothrix sp. EH2]|nr:hypothetical protein [Candidatus Electrothrix sp. EH2]